MPQAKHIVFSQLFTPMVRTDANGYAEVQFRLPFALDYTAAIDAFPDVYKSTPPEVFFEAFTLEGLGINRLTAGISHSAALDGDGQVWTWGRNNWGQLGDGSTVDKWFPQVVADLDPAIQISAGYNSTYALLADGTVEAWGLNSSGQLGNDSTTTSQTPVTVLGLTSIRQIAGGATHALALDESGEVWSWGAGGSGQLGHGDWSNHHTAQKIAAFDNENVAQIAAGYLFSGAIKENGTVWTWGSNSNNKLGNIGSSINVPTQVDGISGAIQLSLGYHHALVLRDDKTVWSWGRNVEGQLGDGTFNGSASPVQVSGLSNVIWIEAGEYHSLALDGSGTLWAWGRNTHGRLGDGTTDNSNTPVEVGELILTEDVAGFAAGGEHSLGITADGTLWGWGRNNHGQLGTGNNFDSLDPSETVLLTLAEKVMQPSLSVFSGQYLSDFEVAASVQTPGAQLRYTLDGSEPDETDTLWPSSGDLEIETSTFLRVRAFASDMVPGETKSATYRIGPSVTAGSSHAAALDGDGTVWTWGRNNWGQLGDGSTVDKWFPQVVSDLDPAIQISAGYNSTYALLADGTVEAWGLNSSGQLGNDSTTTSQTPAEVLGLTYIRQISGGATHALAVDNSGEVWSWGAGGSGQLGHGDWSNHHTAQKIAAFDNIAQVAAGYLFSGAIKKDGTVWTWGSNSNSKLGHSSSSVNVPTQVGSIYDAIRLSLGYHHALVLRGDGTVWSWGRNVEGQLGDGTFTGRNTAVQVTGLSDIVWIEAGEYHSLALDKDGVLYAWGRNTYGRLGDGTTDNSNVPVEVGESVWNESVIGFAAGGEHTAGITAEGTLWGWGRNNHGQLGNSSNTDSADPSEVALLTFASTAGIPQLSHPSGHYATPFTVHATAPAAGSVLRYTADGSEPDANSDLWPTIEGLQITQSTVLKVRAFGSGLLPGKVKTATYRIGASLATGTSHSAALDGDGQVWTWGRNNWGQLGDGSTVDKWFPQVVSDLDPAIQISAGYNSTYALLADGTVEAWGLNSSGQLGNDSTTTSQTPAEVLGLTSIRQISGGATHALAVDNSGEVWSWGAGGSGQLGHGDWSNHHTAQKIAAFDNVAQVAAGYLFSGAIREDGTVWTWGSNSNSKLGHSSSSVNVPTQVGSIYDAIQISLGYHHALVLRGDGTVWSWGRNVEGQLGDGTFTGRSTAVQVTGLSDIVWIEAGEYHSLALDKDGVLYAWGRNTYGRLGDGTTDNSNVPIAITPAIWNGHAIHAMAGGGEHSLGIIDYMGAPVFFSWGRNNYGQLGLGDGSASTAATPILITMPLDSDSDGLYDYEEFLHGFDPLNADTTGTGFGDYVAHQLGLPPGNPVEQIDPNDTSPPVFELLEPADASLLP